uniref:Adaptor related protein complex 5 subunit sigma 1 n=1 Tax=Salvator merianae TaxID=96440 RepID=A0A8D0CA54_SALMN
MVHAFLIHTIRCRPGEEMEPCRVLYSRVFSPEGLDEAAVQVQEKQRLARKEQILVVARQVESACKLHQQASGKPHLEHLIQLPDEPVSLQDAPSGVFRLPAGDPFAEEKTVLWLGLQCLGFALVCDAHENLMLAESTLRLLVKALLDHLKLLSSGSEVLLKADRTEVILQKFLPQGQLLFLNDQFVVGLEREETCGRSCSAEGKPLSSARLLQTAGASSRSGNLRNTGWLERPPKTSPGAREELWICRALRGNANRFTPKGWRLRKERPACSVIGMFLVSPEPVPPQSPLVQAAGRQASPPPLYISSEGYG